MAFLLTCEIQIGNYLAKFANSVEVNSSWNTLGDTCTIKLPNLAGKLEKDFKTGDVVTVKLGYDGKLVTEFEGYIAEIKPKIPFEIRCEDEIYKLKRSNLITKSYKSIKLKDLLKEIVPSATLSDSIPDVTLSPFVLNKVTVAQVLQKLKEEYLLVAYFRNKKLFVGLPYTEQGLGQVRYKFQQNIISDDLTYKRKEDVRLKAKAISIQGDNTRVEVQVGDEDGEERTLYFRNITNKDALKAIASRELEKYKYEGYRGKFLSFGIPYVEHSQTAIIIDEKYPTRQGNYVIDSVKTTWGESGFRREIELGKKV